VARGAAAVRAFAELGWPTVLHGTCSWNPAHSRNVPVLMDVGLATHDERAAWWRASLEDGELAGVDVAAETAQFHLAPKQIARAALSARQQAALRGEPVTPDDLRAALAPRTPPSSSAAPGDLAGRRLRGSRPAGRAGRPAARARGPRAPPRARARRVGARQGLLQGPRHHRLFAGDSGTGKTMSAEVVAHDLGLDLYVIDLSTVVDKYIGETEKNLDRVFSDAED